MVLVFGLKETARCLVSQIAETERNRWIVGTLSKQQNKIYILDYDEDTDSLSTIEYPYQNQIKSISSCTRRKEWVFACDKTASLMSLNEPSFPGSTNADADKLTEINENIDAVVWEPNGNISKILAYRQDYAALYNLDESGSNAKNFYQIPISNPKEKTTCAAWSPHSDKTICLGTGQAIVEYDTRTKRVQSEINRAHQIQIRDIDYNVNKPFHIASCGDDCMVRIWDTRQSSQPLMEISDHSHWVWNASFNKYHDQMLISCSSDSKVNLQSVVSVSSALLSDTSNSSEVEDESNKPKDGLIATFDEHEDSCYSVAWSPSDPWIFASLSFDGRVVINYVPHEEKYKIIL